MANLVMLSSGTLSRYLKPLNQLSSMVANVLFAYVVYLVPAFFPHLIWLGLAPVLIGTVLQVLAHAIFVNIKIRSVYSPGVATAVFGFLPVGVLYIHHIGANSLVHWWDWPLAVPWLVVSGYLTFYLFEQQLLGDAPYPFDPDEMERFGIARKFARAEQRREEKKLQPVT